MAIHKIVTHFSFDIGQSPLGDCHPDSGQLRLKRIGGAKMQKMRFASGKYAECMRI